MLNATAAPSAIVEAIQATGRDAILRGSGASDSECLPFLALLRSLPYGWETPPPATSHPLPKTNY